MTLDFRFDKDLGGKGLLTTKRFWKPNCRNNVTASDSRILPNRIKTLRVLQKLFNIVLQY